ncbi:MAG: hypothetical protein ACP5RP_02615 [Candidatus Micrarchaeia archaeon]
MGAADELFDQVLKKYNIPEWTKPYIYEYIKKDPLNAIKKATSFVDVKRKKGEVTSKYIKLPNGTILDINLIVHLMSTLFYIENRLSVIGKKWKESLRSNRSYYEYYSALEEVSLSHARAIKIIMEGMNKKIIEPEKEMVDLLDYIESISDPSERIIATELALRYSFAKSFGLVFYKVFYPAAPELMRTLSKAFEENNSVSKLGEEELKKIIKESDLEVLSKNLHSILLKVYSAIESELPIADKAGIKNEIELVRDISIAYPYYELSECGFSVDIQKEVESIKRDYAGGKNE